MVGVVLCYEIFLVLIPHVWSGEARRGEARRNDGMGGFSVFEVQVRDFFFLLVESVVWKCICVSVRWCSFTCWCG